MLADDPIEESDDDDEVVAVLRAQRALAQSHVAALQSELRQLHARARVVKAALGQWRVHDARVADALRSHAIVRGIDDDDDGGPTQVVRAQRSIHAEDGV